MEISPENLEKSKTGKNYRQNFEYIFFAQNGTYVEKFTSGQLCAKFEGFIFIYEAIIAKNEFGLLWTVK